MMNLRDARVNQDRPNPAQTWEDFEAELKSHEILFGASSYRVVPVFGDLPYHYWVVYPPNVLARPARPEPAVCPRELLMGDENA